jgi:hypothetical protein
VATYPKEARNAAVFARIMGAAAYRDLIDIAVSGGVTLKAPLPTRGNDAFRALRFRPCQSCREPRVDRDQNSVIDASGPMRPLKLSLRSIVRNKRLALGACGLTLATFSPPRASPPQITPERASLTRPSLGCEV